MNLKEIRIWATQQYANDNVQFLAAGVKERYLAKIKPHLRSIIDKSSEVLTATELNNKKIEIIQRDINNLIAWGLPAADEPNKPEPAPEPVVEPVTAAKESEEPKKQGWYSKR